MGKKLEEVRAFVAEQIPLVPEEKQPKYHVTGGVGWINDPNGFSVYGGEYHLFFQYFPYAKHWGPIMWGHVKSSDFIRWERLPPAIVPDQPYDKNACCSGSAIELPDGRHMLMYTGANVFLEEENLIQGFQTQCVALGDGRDYEKWEGNPVLDGTDLPQGFSEYDFRDPKIWRDPDGEYYAVIASRSEERGGAALLYGSPDAFSWRYIGIIAESNNIWGTMWECPDFFPLGDRHILLFAPMGELKAEIEAPERPVIALLGQYGPDHALKEETAQAVDQGYDFYAPHTLQAPDGRRVMIAWLQSWITEKYPQPDVPFFGQMILPRELSIKNGRLCQRPVRELDAYHGDKTAYRDVHVSERTSLQGVNGRVIDLTVEIRPGASGYSRFILYLAHSAEYSTKVEYSPGDNTVRVDRSNSGYPTQIASERAFQVRDRQGKISFRILLDRFSMELFVNDGEQTASWVLYTPMDAEGIVFACEGGSVEMDIEKYILDL